MKHDYAAQVAFTLAAFLGQYMAAMRLAVLELPGSTTRKPLRGPSVTFQFWHYIYSG
jgi:hypothetical protein